MGKVITKAGGGGVMSDDLTVTAGDVLKGKTYVGVDTDDEIGTGTLELTGNAVANDVLKGKSFYSTDAKTKITGALEVQSVINFKVASVSGVSVTFTWQNPAKGLYGGILIRYKEGSYPISPTDGMLLYKGTGSNIVGSGQSSTVCNVQDTNKTYYLSVFSYCLTNENILYSIPIQLTVFIPKLSGIVRITESKNFTVPAGAHQIQVFVVGGGGTGGGNRSTNLYGGGGGGGYTNTGLFSVVPGTVYPVTIGAGGAGIYERGPENGNPGGKTSFGTLLVANGGGFGSRGGASGNGGSGGSFSRNFRESGYDGNSYGSGDGGSNGSNGYAIGLVGSVVSRRLPPTKYELESSGNGQNRTTGEFGDNNGTKYSGGGAAYVYNSFTTGRNLGPGANGGPISANSGGGSAGSGASSGDGSSRLDIKPGGSGICVIKYV